MSDQGGAGQFPGQPHFSPPTTGIALVPGGVLLWIGLWVVTDGGSLPVGWALFSLGLVLATTGAVALGVAWGLAMHRSRPWGSAHSDPSGSDPAPGPH